jgi:Arginase family
MSDQSYLRPDVVGGGEYDPMKEPRYAQIATFMRAPLARSLDEVDIGLIGVPTDLGVTNRPGARHGPREIRNASSLMRAFNLGLDLNPYDLCRIADLGVTYGFRTASTSRSRSRKSRRSIERCMLPAYGPLPRAAITRSPIRYSERLPPRRLSGWCTSTRTPTDV